MPSTRRGSPSTVENDAVAPVSRAAVVGLGPIGNSWTVAFARAGIPVTAFDLDPGRRETLHEECRRSLEGLGLPADAIAAALALVATAGSLEAAAAAADLVQEAASERLDVKRSVFAELDRVAPADAVIASSTSAMPLSTFAADLAGRARMLIAHPATPPHLLPIVELVPAPFTPEATVRRAAEVMRHIGQSPIVVRKEIRAFVMNRVLAAMFVEMARLVRDGVVSARDADAAIRDGFALRWPSSGRSRVPTSTTPAVSRST